MAPGTGGRASNRLFDSAKSGRQQREALQAALALRPETDEKDARIPRPSAKSAELAANRYDKVMSHTVAGRYRKEAMAIARAKGEGDALSKDVYNYGDMLFQEANMTRERRDAWRRNALREKEEAEQAEATFHPQLNKHSVELTASSISWGGGGGGEGGSGDDELLARFDRRAAEKQGRQAALRELVEAEERKQWSAPHRHSSPGRAASAKPCIFLIGPPTSTCVP